MDPAEQSFDCAASLCRGGGSAPCRSRTRRPVHDRLLSSAGSSMHDDEIDARSCRPPRAPREPAASPCPSSAVDDRHAPDSDAFASGGITQSSDVELQLGAQLRSRRFVRALNRFAMVGSMGRVGAAGDNVAGHLDRIRNNHDPGTPTGFLSTVTCLCASSHPPVSCRRQSGP